MRYALFLCCIIISVRCDAFIADSAGYLLRGGISGVYALPQGQFSAQHNNRLIIGQCLPAAGIDFYMSVSLPCNFTAGITGSDVAYRLNTGKLYSQLYERYSRPGYYTTVTIATPWFDVGTLSLLGSYVWKHKRSELEPYVLIGMGFANEGYFNDNYDVTRKRMNEHYSETISPFISARMFFYPGIGFRANRQLGRHLFLSAGMQYNYGLLRYKLGEEQRDFMNYRTTSYTSFIQPISVLSFHAGVQYRFVRLISPPAK